MIKKPKFYILLITSFILVYTSTIAQTSTDNDSICISPKNGRLIFTYKNKLLLNNEQLVSVLRSSDNLSVQKQLKKYKRRDNLAGVIGGIGIGFIGIWLINEGANPNFHSTDPADQRWKRILISTTLTFSFSGLTLSRSSKRQLLKSIESFNKTKIK